VLQIAIHGDDGVALGKIVTAGEGDLLAEVAAQGYPANPVILLPELNDLLPGVIRASIIYQNKLQAMPGAYRVAGLPERFYKVGQDGRFVEAGDDDGYQVAICHDLKFDINSRHVNFLNYLNN